MVLVDVLFHLLLTIPTNIGKILMGIANREHPRIKTRILHGNNVFRIEPPEEETKNNNP
jgi:hypothetical protein